MSEATRYRDLTITRLAWEDERVRHLLIADACDFVVERYGVVSTLNDGSRCLRAFGRSLLVRDAPSTNCGTD
jgi:hypothetical protein